LLGGSGGRGLFEYPLDDHVTEQENHIDGQAGDDPYQESLFNRRACEHLVDKRQQSNESSKLREEGTHENVVADWSEKRDATCVPIRPAVSEWDG
jgi:hypothetical protein